MAKAKAIEKPYIPRAVVKHHGKYGAKLGTGVAALILSYIFLTRALDTGSYWQYSACVFFLYAGIVLVVRSFKKQV